MGYEGSKRSSEGPAGQSTTGTGDAGVGKRTLTMGLPATSEGGAGPLGPVRVTASALRVRREPSTARLDSIFGTLSRGTVVTPLDKAGDWLRIEQHGEPGFIHGGHVVAIASPLPVTPAPAPHDEDQGVATADARERGPVTPAVEPLAEVRSPTNTAAPAPQLSGNYRGMFSKVYDTGAQKVQVLVSPGGLSPTPDIYLHFHGHYADYGIDPELAWDPKSGSANPRERPAPVRSGIDQATSAMKAAQGKNTIAILPQGVLGQGTQVANDLSHEGGYMEDLQRQGLPGFLAKILGPLANDLGITAGLAPGNIAIGGHSAGGYMGAHTALSKAGALADSITDLTFFDASYAAAHLEDARQWMTKGKPGKNLRIVNSWSQQSEKSARPDWRENWFSRFGPAALERLAKGKAMTVRQLGIGEKLDADTTVMQHSQLIAKDGAVQCDILVTMTSMPGGHDHEPLRDRYIDDAMLSIGGGVAGNQEFGHYQDGALTPPTAAPATPPAVVSPTAEKRAEPERDSAPLPPADTTVAAPDVPVDPKVHTLPQPVHADGDATGPHEGDPRREVIPILAPRRTGIDRSGSGPEQVKPPPVVAKPTSAKSAHLVEGDREAIKAGLYGKDGTGGIISRDKLHQHTVAHVNGKRVNIDLSDEEFDFKQRVYEAAIKTLGKQIYGGVNEKDLTSIGHGQRIRKEVVGPLNAMLAAMKRELPEGHETWVGSGYRDPVEDFSIWDNKFNEIYLRSTKPEREKQWPTRPFGPEAVDFTVQQIAPRKAPPGGSNHSNGIAVDLHVSIHGKDVSVSFGDQRAYKATPQYQWLHDNAKHHHFENWYKEAWHYDYRP